jgi:hypothetical protein
VVDDSGAARAASWLSSPSNQPDQPGYGDQMSSQRAWRTGTCLAEALPPKPPAGADTTRLIRPAEVTGTR